MMHHCRDVPLALTHNQMAWSQRLSTHRKIETLKKDLIAMASNLRAMTSWYQRSFILQQTQFIWRSVCRQRSIAHDGMMGHTDHTQPRTGSMGVLNL